MVTRPERLILISFGLFVLPSYSFFLAKPTILTSSSGCQLKGERALSSSSSTAEVEESSNEHVSIDAKNNFQNITKSDDEGPRKCYWKPKGPKARWKERILIQDLKVGQELSGHLVEEYLEGKTGPKLFFDCGVGRTNPKTGDWSIVTAMLRLDRGKASVIKKRTARYRKKDGVPLFVARIQLECARLEVCATLEDLAKYTTLAPKVSITSLKPNQEVVGDVVKLLPYGAVVDIGANRKGLLHITKVADLYGRFIKKEKGLEEAGLEKGSRVRLKVGSIDKRKLSLEFTDDVTAGTQEILIPDSPQAQSNECAEIPGDELDAWEEYAKSQSSQLADIARLPVLGMEGVDNKSGELEAEYYDDDDDSNDEDADIEDAFGIGMY